MFDAFSMEYQYLDLLRDVMETGKPRPAARASVATHGIFGDQLTDYIGNSFPLLVTKRVPFKSVRGELQGFLCGATSAEQFRAVGTSIWNANANETPAWLANPHRKGKDDLGRIYSAQYVDWRTPEGGSVNQVANLLKGLKENPYDRAHIVTAWNPGEMDRMALRPCHMFYQCYVEDIEDGGRVLNLKMYQRSADIFLGVPFNMASYALLLHLIANLLGYTPGWLTMDLGDVHLYDNHREAATTLLARTPRGMPAPTLRIPPEAVAKAKDHLARREYAMVMVAVDFSLITVENYHPQAAIPAPMAV